MLQINRLSLLDVEHSILHTLIAEGVGVAIKDIKIMIPERRFGHLASNFPIILGKQSNPIEIFEHFKSKLASLPYIKNVEFVKGFCNFWLSDDFFTDSIRSHKQLGEEFGYTDLGKRQKVNIEYISGNPTGTLHLGHLRGLYADALSNLLQFLGYDVTREYYINDMGNQVEILGRSILYAIYTQNDIPCVKPEECYESDEINAIADNIKNHYGHMLLAHDLNPDDAKVCGKEAIKLMVDYAKEQLAYMKVKFDVWKYESELKEITEKAVKILEDEKLIEVGVLGEVEAKRGAASNAPIKIYKGSKAVTKANGTYTYFGSDIGYLCDKISRGYDWIIYCIGAEQAPNFDILSDMANHFDYKGKLSIIKFQTIDMVKNEQKLKFSKRGGNIIRPTDLQLPNSDVLRMMILQRRNDTHFSINLDNLSIISKDNPYYFIMSEAKRSKSVMQAGITEGALTSAMTDLAHTLSQLPSILVQATESVNILVDYLMDIACELNQIWNDGVKNEENKWGDVIIRQELLQNAIATVNHVIKIMGMSQIV